MLLSLWTGCSRALSAPSGVYGKSVGSWIIFYLENEKHIEINYDNFWRAGKGVSRDLLTLASKTNKELLGPFLAWSWMLSHTLSGIWSWHGRRWGGLRMNFFIPGAWSLPGHKYSAFISQACWNRGIAVMLMLGEGIVHRYKHKAHRNLVKRWFQKH